MTIEGALVIVGLAGIGAADAGVEAIRRAVEDPGLAFEPESEATLRELPDAVDPDNARLALALDWPRSRDFDRRAHHEALRWLDGPRFAWWRAATTREQHGTEDQG
jgi:hypothetical protein